MMDLSKFPLDRQMCSIELASCKDDRSTETSLNKVGNCHYTE